MLRGEPSWQTSSTGPTSMPSSSEAVATTARSSPARSRASTRSRRSIERLPWWACTLSSPRRSASWWATRSAILLRVDEHERRAVLVDVAGDPLEHRRHLLEGRHGSELVVGQLDGDVERPPVPDVDDGAARLAVGPSSGPGRRRRAAGRSSLSAAGSPTARSGRAVGRRSAPSGTASGPSGPRRRASPRGGRGAPG